MFSCNEIAGLCDEKSSHQVKAVSETYFHVPVTRVSLVNLAVMFRLEIV